MTLLRSMLLGLLLLLAGACSMDTAIERMSAPEDRAFARGFVEDLRAGRLERLEPQFRADLWAESAPQLAAAGRLYPAGKGETKLIGYHMNSQVGTGGSLVGKQYTLVTTDGRRWTETVLLTEARGGAAQIVGWRVTPFDEPPPNVRLLEQYEAALPWIRAGAVALLLVAAALVFWLVRRYRRRRDA